MCTNSCAITRASHGVSALASLGSPRVHTKIVFPNGSVTLNVRAFHSSFLGGRLISTFAAHSS